MQSLSYYCGQCGSLLQVAPTGAVQAQGCPTCQTPTHLMNFPALAEAPKKGELGRNVIVDNESSCFEHPEKQAMVACQRCGKFLCSLCDIEWGTGHLCSTCVAAGPDKQEAVKPAQRFFHYDSIALILSMLIVSPMYIFSILTAPVALFMCVYYWRKLTPSPRSRIRFILAGFLAIATLGIWILGLGFAFLGEGFEV